jgi:cell division protein FtsB
MGNVLDRINKKQVFAIAGFFVFVILLMDLNTRINEYFNVNSQRSKIQTEVADLWQTRQVLLTHIAYATSEVAVEEWAREEGYLVQPGDIRVVPIQSGLVTPTLQSTVVPTPVIAENWEIWKEVFLGN